MSKKRRLKDSGWSSDERESKRRKKSHKSDNSDNDSKHSKSKSKHKSKHKHKKSKHKKHDRNSDNESSNNGTNNKYINHSQWKYLRISTDDYYKYHTEFADWALVKHKKFLDEISTKKCKKLFKKFVKKWNDGKLEEKYYKTFSSLSIDNNQKTRYKWSFEKKVDSKEQMKMDLIRDTIDNQTNDDKISNQIALIFQQKFERKRERDDKRRNRNKGGNGDVEFVKDGNGNGGDNKNVNRRDNDKQRRLDRRKRIKEKKQMDKYEKEKAMLASYQSFISEPSKKRKK
eukprot:261050_1